MQDSAYDAAISAATKELGELRAERARIDIRIKRLTETVATLFRLTLSDQPENVINLGLTDAIRACLRTGYPQPAPSSAIVAGLESAGYDFSGYSNKQASVNGTLQRLTDNGEVKKT